MSDMLTLSKNKRIDVLLITPIRGLISEMFLES